MKKTIITRTVKINAPSNKVWDALADFGNVQNLSPNIASSYLMTEQPNGVGATRHCNFTMMGAEVDEKITQWDLGKSLTIELYNPKKLPFMRMMEANFKIEA